MITEPRHAHSYDTVVYRVHNNNNVVIFWTMTSIHVPDRQPYIGLRQAHMLYRIDNSIIGTPSSSHKRRYDTSCKYTAIRNLIPQPVDLTPIPQLLPYMQSFFSFGQHVIYQVPNIAKEIQNNR